MHPLHGVYRGRFAPSPTGPLHWGSLYAAVASWLDARSHAGTWLVRIEDVDGQRCRPEWTDAILNTLDRHGLISDEPVIRQSERGALYQEHLNRLIEAGHVYACPCSRKDLQQGHRPDCPAPGTRTDIAWRLRFHAQRYSFFDRRLGLCTFPPAPARTDPVLRRRDGFWAYQLAVVADDIAQGVTDIVRGEDLLTSTPVQLHLYRLLGNSAPRYLHLPLVTRNGQKLSKQNLAEPVSDTTPTANLLQVLQWLGINLDATAETSPARLLQSAIRHWPPIRALMGGDVQLPDPA
ncbi:MAG: tRNA glutamyl-Q(34) synthetase GluQRS [Gammaproteobacteria bacterium]|nr:MAG: tRNA glutamyl-Q(34) synthetase GluQRS [Gammaproteobacteria bacterium]